MKHRATYSLLDEIMASATEPMPPEKRRHQLTRMHQGLASMERDPAPTTDAWRVCSDAVNIMETLVNMGELIDGSGLLADAIAALATAGQRHRTTGAAIRLDAGGIQAVRAVLEDYAAAAEALPARTMVRSHRLTERRLREIFRGKIRAGDVVVTV